MISRCRATIEPGTPSVRDGRDNYGLGGRCVACADPLYVGAGAPLPRGEGHKFPIVASWGRALGGVAAVQNAATLVRSWRGSADQRSYATAKHVLGSRPQCRLVRPIFDADLSPLSSRRTVRGRHVAHVVE